MKRFILTCIFMAYSALLIKVMVFKDVPVIKLGQLMFNFGGTNGGHPPNFVPFTTIVPYLFGEQGLVIAGINLLGNVAFLVPIGLLAPFVFKNMTWKKSLILSVATGLIIEIMQAVLDLGIFDVDDVILNALGVMVGYWSFVILANWIRSKKYKHIVTALLTIIIVISASLYALYPKNQPVVSPADRAASKSGNPCGRTNGTGKIVSIKNNTITIERNDGNIRPITLTGQTTIKNSAGPASKNDLKAGDRITVVIDDSETASLVLVCGA